MPPNRELASCSAGKVKSVWMGVDTYGLLPVVRTMLEN